MNDHTLNALEFSRVLNVIAGYATSEPGAEAVRSLRPVSEPDRVAAALDEVDEMVSWLIRDSMSVSISQSAQRNRMRCSPPPVNRLTSTSSCLASAFQAIARVGSPGA